MKLNIGGLATGIGSLPYRNTDEALDLIFKYMPQIPFWPQLPKRDIREGMITQYSQRLPCLHLTLKGLVFDSLEQEIELTRFYEHIISADVNYFEISPDFSAGFWRFISRLKKEDMNKVEFIKGHVTGPYTFAAGIKDDKERAILHNQILFQAVREGLAMKARWQIEVLRRLGKPIIIFIDEPYLTCLGSGFAPINRNDIVAGLTEFTEKFKAPDVLIGVHCCGNTDWSVFTDITNINIINFDAYNYLDRILLYSENLRNFFQRSGILAWGIVPTEDFDAGINVDVLRQKLNAGVKVMIKKGIEERLIREGLLLTPACGLGALNPDRTELIFKCLAELSAIIAGR